MTAFDVALHWKDLSAFTDRVVRTYHPIDDDIRSILSDVCSALDGFGSFHISGFGDSRWPLDIATDLCVFLEQLPAALVAIQQEDIAELDLYEQGIERKLEIQCRGNYCVVMCVSYGDWVPACATEELDRQALIGMLSEVRSEFMRAFDVVAPTLISHPWVLNWLKGK